MDVAARLQDLGLDLFVAKRPDPRAIGYLRSVL
jgi:hypothetical protein